MTIAQPEEQGSPALLPKLADHASSQRHRLCCRVLF